MTVRTTRSTVTFRGPFTLKAIDGEQAPGVYEIETDEAVMEGNDLTAYRRIATLFHVRRGGTTRTYRVDRRDLEAALARDAAA
jgi:hypothetical protein